MKSKLIVIDIEKAEYILYCYKDRSMVLAQLTNEELELSKYLGTPCKECNANMEIIGWQAAHI